MKQLFNILLSFLVIVNLTISFDHLSYDRPAHSGMTVELPFQEKPVEIDALQWSIAKQSLPTLTLGRSTYLFKTSELGLLSHHFSTLKLAQHRLLNKRSLQFKSLLLFIKINDISIQNIALPVIA